MPKLQFKPLHDALDDYDLLLFDLWGVVIEGTQLYAGVIDALNDIIGRKKVIFLTNAPRPDAIVARNLGNWGIKGVTPEMVVSSGGVARDLMKKHVKFSEGLKIFHLGADRNQDILLDIEHEPVTDLAQADILLLSLYKDEHENINEHDELLMQAAQKPGLMSICCNPDTIIPVHGMKRYCAGYFAKIIEAHGGHVTYTGKPNLPIYERVFIKYPNLDKQRIVMIGDTFDTDILGAWRSGIHSALVLTGNALPLHADYEHMDDKLAAIMRYGQQIKIMPNFVTKIAIL
jgi:HAD superfamily hydrolase (TIGR01459 family)